jgi:DNA-binding NarL/FixJ family response regulator
VRVTILRGTDDVASVLPGMVLLSPAGDLQGLTPRELEVLGLLVEGCANQEIARALVVAPRTVAAHVEHILVKLGAPSRTLAAVRAERSGLYVPTRAFTSPSAAVERVACSS